MNKWYLKLVSALVLSVAALSAQAEQIARIGSFGDDGRIKLDLKRLQTHFPDGSPIAELDVRISNGFLHLYRKGYDDDSACQTELIELTDQSGLPLVATTYDAGNPAFLSSLSPTKFNYCRDAGCYWLRFVVQPGQPPLLRAACDQTELSDNRCRCHVDDGSGDVVMDEKSLCDSNLGELLQPLVSWAKLRYIKNQ